MLSRLRCYVFQSFGGLGNRRTWGCIQHNFRLDTSAIHKIFQTTYTVSFWHSINSISTNISGNSEELLKKQSSEHGRDVETKKKIEAKD